MQAMIPVRGRTVPYHLTITTTWGANSKGTIALDDILISSLDRFCTRK